MIEREEYDRQLGALASSARKARGMAQKDLADAVGLSQKRMSDLETGRRWAAWHVFLVCRALQLDVPAFFGGTLQPAAEEPGDAFEQLLLDRVRSGGAKEGIRFLVGFLD